MDSLLAFCEIHPDQVNPVDRAEFPIRVTRYFASLVEKGNAKDPLLLQVIPRQLELERVKGFQEDAVGDRLAVPVPGLIHKYHGRVLLTLTGACPIHCRYCFRQHFPYADNTTPLSQDGAVMQYLREHEEVSEVILSGGDPLMLGDRKLEKLVLSLNTVPHIRTLRVHSRLLSVLPERITTDLLEIMALFQGRVVFVTHINHPNEISAPNQAAFELLHRRGHGLLNQSVLLRGVNDDPGILAELSHRLFESRISPYYLHRLDRVHGAAHFAVSLERSCEIYRQLRRMLPGYLVPAFVEEYYIYSSYQLNKIQTTSSWRHSWIKG